MSVAITLVIEDEAEVLCNLERLDFFREKIMNHVINPTHGGLALTDDERIEYRGLVAWFEGVFFIDILRKLRAAA